MNSIKVFQKIFFVLVALPLLLISQDSDCLAEEKELARLDSVSGIFEVKERNSASFKSVPAGTVLKAYDTIRTSSDCRAAILFTDGTILRLAPNTTIQFQEPSTSDSANLDMSEGTAHFFEREPKQLPVINSPSVTTAVRGTEFVIKVSKNSTEVSVLDGLVECKNTFGSASAIDREIITTRTGQAPVKSILIDPEEAVQWVLNYPSLIKPGDLEDNAGRQTISKVQALLSAGKVSEAELLLNQAASSAANSNQVNSALNAQKAIIATVQNKNDSALILAAKSWEQNNTVAAATANAYAYQAVSRLTEAKDWLEKALVLEPDNAFVLARLAEIDLGSGQIEEADEKIQKAIQISPADPYVLGVLGFSQLIMDKRELATESFSQAMKYGPGLGLAHLGYGLALIQKGDLEAGQKEIEIAAALEPNVSIYRSYLGKAFFEQKRESMALQEYERAISLDSQDPTPYLYRAFSQLSANKTVDALKDLEKSIELNNNRAVYRSSLLLDQDLGVKSAGLAQVFNDLGFSQAARVEAIKSINSSYSNYSAHRLLSGSYNTIFLNDAGLAEDKISTLLAPLSFNLYSQGSSVASFNEYNSLFDRNQTQAELGGEFQSDDNIFQPNVSVSGKEDKFGYLLSSDSLFTDEEGIDNDSRRYKTRLALQYQADYQNFFLVDGSSLYRKAFNDNQAPDEVKAEDYAVDLGYRHSFSQNSNLIFSSTLANQHSRYVSHFAEREVELIQQFQGMFDQSLDTLLIDDASRESVKSIRNTAQWIYDSELFSLVTGTQIYSANANREENSPVYDDQQNVFKDLGYYLDSSGFNQLYSTDYYSYSTLHLSPSVDFNAGVSFTEVELEDREVTPFADDTFLKSHLSPKVGFTFYPTEQLTIRSAYFETLRKSSLEDQTSLEPTLVGGINQRFTDFSGDLSRTFGLGADYKIAASTYFGVEGFRRNVSSSLRPAISQINLDYDTFTASNEVLLLETGDLYSNQNIVRSYIYQVLTDRFVATLNNEWADLERTDPDFGQDITLNKTAFGIRYIDPRGWYLLTEATNRYQDRDGSDFAEDGSDNFCLLDAALGYRLPKQQGALEFRINNIFDKEFTYDQSFGLEEFVRNDTNFIMAFTVRY